MTAETGERADRRYALIVASSDYDDPKLRRLVAPARDAEALARVLEEPDIGGFDVTTMTNSPSSTVAERIEVFFSGRTRRDMLLLYFSGHGIKDEDGRLYFATVNTRNDRLRATAIPAAFLHDVMSASRSRRQVLVLDCCHSGAFARGMTAKSAPRVGVGEHLGGEGRVVLTASDAMQFAYQDGRISGEGVQSVFTRHLVKGLIGGAADLNGDGWVSLDEWYDYAYENVVAGTPSQVPAMWAFGVQGHLTIARNPSPGTRASTAVEPDVTPPGEDGAAAPLPDHAPEESGAATPAATVDTVDAVDKTLAQSPAAASKDTVDQAPDHSADTARTAGPEVTDDTTDAAGETAVLAPVDTSDGPVDDGPVDTGGESRHDLPHDGSDGTIEREGTEDLGEGPVVRGGGEPQPWWTRRPAAAVAVIALVALGVLSAFLLRRGDDPTLGATEPGNAGGPGKLVAFETTRDGNREIYVMAAGGGDERNLTNSDGEDRAPAWSPDGEHLVFASDRDGPSGLFALFVVNTDGGDVRKLTDGGAVVADDGLRGDLDPAWSPDGEQILFARSDGQDWDLHVVPADGGQPELLTEVAGTEQRPTWSPDGTRIAFQGTRDASAGFSADIYVMNADGSDVSNVTSSPSRDFHPAWSPDGDRIAFSRRADDDDDIYTVGAGGEDPRNLTGTPDVDERKPDWSPDGANLVFERDDGSGEAIVVMTADGSEVTVLSSGREDFDPAW